MDDGLGRRVLPVGVTLLAIAVSGALAVFPVLRFSSHLANEVAGKLLLVALPWVLVVILFRVGRWWMTAVGVAGALFLGVATPFLFFALMFDSEFEPIQEFDWQGSRVRVYRGDAGAMSSWSIELRQERTLLPGLLWVRPIAMVHRCYSVRLEPTESGVRVAERNKGCAGPPIGLEFPLKRFLYF